MDVDTLCVLANARKSSTSLMSKRVDIKSFEKNPRINDERKMLGFNKNI